MLSRIRQHVDSERKLEERVFKVFRHSKGLQSVSKFQELLSSNTLGNKSALVMRICTTFTCFKLFDRENVAFYTKQNFLFRKFLRIERASISITRNRGKCGDIQTSKYLKRAWLLAQGTQAGQVRDRN